MLFNSIDFAIFLPIVFLLYWALSSKPLKYQNILLLIASYTFYGWWDWRFLFLMLFSSCIDYFVGLQLSKTEAPKTRKALLLLSVFMNIGFLGFFKYYNFFAESFTDAFTLLGVPFTVDRLAIILPVGISFYTFQTMSYTIDVHRKKMPATKDAISFFAFISFFPQLVAGPIERATNLLPQFFAKRKFDYHYAAEGAKQMLWGLFKKMVIADNCAMIASAIYENHEVMPGGTLWLGAILFHFQWYCDFSGYSDIAIGTAKLFGFRLSQNFAYPFFSRDIAEFWRRWHISLSTWFRDYLYIPLGGSRGSTANTIRNIFIIFIVSGFWHGANWTFIVWGAIHAFYFVPYFLLGRNRNHLEVVAMHSTFPKLKELGAMLFTFFLTTIAWVVFISEDLKNAISYLKGMFTRMPILEIDTDLRTTFLIAITMILFLIVMEWQGRRETYAIEVFWKRKPKVMRLALYYGLAMTIFLLAGKQQEFVYFQF